MFPPVPVTASSFPATDTDDVSSPLVLHRNRRILPGSSQPPRGAASQICESSVRVHENAAEQIEERQTKWAYSKPIIVIDVLWNLAFLFVSIAVLGLSSEENPDDPLRFWIVGCNLQCLFHVGCVTAEYRRRRRQSDDYTNEASHSDSSFNHDSSEYESSDYNVREDSQIEPGTSLAKRLESTNAIFSFVWWIIGFYWVTADSEKLAHSSPQLYWLCVAFLAFEVLFLALCAAVACLISIAFCCCFPFFITFRVPDRRLQTQGASDEEIKRLPKFKFLTVRNSEKVNDEIRETHGGIMTQLGVDSPTELVISSDQTECCICLCDYEDGTELRELSCRHHFHAACIDKWLRINGTCPRCKCNILKTGEHVEIIVI